MSKFFTVLMLATGWLAATSATGQGLGNSPYSRIGLGDLNTTGNIRNFSMGGAGLSSPNNFQINYQNPALLYYNNSVTFELSLVSQIKSLKQDTRSQTDGNTTLNNIGLAIPVSKRWTSAIGLKPFSRVDYEVNTTQPFAGDPTKNALVKFTGSGAISEAYFAHGVKVAKDLMVGGSVSYIFGTIDNNQVTGIEGGTGFDQVLVRNQTRHSDFLFKLGTAYRHKFGKYNFGAGATYNLATNIDAERQTVVERPIVSGMFIDTINRFVEGTVKLPSAFQAGISIDNAANWALMLDLSHQDYSKFESYEGNKELQNATQLSLGGEFVPEPASSKYFKRVAYRAGLRYGQTPYSLNSKQLNDMAFTWGFSMPLGRALVTEAYFLNLGFAAGKRGTTTSNLIQENYFQMQVGVSLSNKWFVRRQLD